MIDALFGSKTRVKLLHLFLNNPGQSFYVREITRKIGEQINSVRRELSNMIEIGIITSDSADNKLYYQVNQAYEYYLPLKVIFGDGQINNNVSLIPKANSLMEEYGLALQSVVGIRIGLFSGVLVKGSRSLVDILLVGDVNSSKIKTFIDFVEKNEGHEINYSVLSYDDFYYRLSVRDKFITEILNGKHIVVVDQDKTLSKE